MQLEFAGVNRREKILAEQRQQREGEDTNGQKADGEKFVVAHANFQHAVITVAQPLESMFEPLLHARENVGLFLRLAFGQQGVIGEQVARHGRHNRARQNVGRQHGERNRFGQRDEQVARDSGEEKHRNEHDTNREGRNQRRHGDLRRAVQNRLDDFLALIDVAIDVFDFDRGVVNQNADRQRQPAKGHDIDRFAQRAHDDDGGENGKWNGHRDDQRAAPTAQEHQNHETGEAGGDQSLADYAGDRGFHEDGLVRQWVHFQSGRQAGGYRRQQTLDAGNDVQGRNIAGLQNGHQGRALTIDANDVGLRREPVAHVGHIANVDRGGSYILDRQIVQLSDLDRRTIHVDFVLVVANLRGARRQNQILKVDGVHHVVRRKTLGLQGVGIQIDLNLALFAAVGVRNRRSGNADQPGADEVQANVAELLLGKALAG